MLYANMLDKSFINIAFVIQLFLFTTNNSFFLLERDRLELCVHIASIYTHMPYLVHHHRL
jgi:hypothetical protein